MLTSLFHLISAALIVSGLDKLRAPSPATDAMHDAGLPRLPGRRWTRAPGVALGAVECTIGGVALTVPNAAPAVAVAALYLLFALFVLRLRSVDAAAGCGCFGAANTPPTRAHLGLDLAAAVVGAGALFAGDVPTLMNVLAGGVGQAVPYGTLLVVGSVLLLTGPSLFATLQPRDSGSRETRIFALNESR